MRDMVLATIAEQPDIVAARCEHCLGVTAHSHRPIDHPAPAARSQKKCDLVDEDGNVNR